MLLPDIIGFMGFFYCLCWCFFGVCVVFFFRGGVVVVVVFFSFFVGVGGWDGVSCYGFKEACC